MKTDTPTHKPIPIATRCAAALLVAVSAAAACPFAIPNTAQATSVISLDDDDMVSMSDWIVYGRISETHPMRYDDSSIITAVTLDVREYIKVPDTISSGDKFTFYTRGGSLGELTQTVSGEMAPSNGMDVVVFLENIPRYGNRPMLLGLKQGLFEIAKPADSAIIQQNRAIIRDLGGLMIVPNPLAKHGPSHAFRNAATLGELMECIKDKISEHEK